MSDFSSLPTELKQKIFSYLTWEERIKAESISKEWQQILRNKLWYLAPIKVSISAVFDMEGIRNLFFITHLYSNFIPQTDEFYSAVQRKGNKNLDIYLFPIGFQPEIDVFFVFFL